MEKEMIIVFKIKDSDVKEKIKRIRKSCVNFTKLFIKWVMEYKISAEK